MERANSPTRRLGVSTSPGVLFALLLPVAGLTGTFAAFHDPSASAERRYDRARVTPKIQLAQADGLVEQLAAQRAVEAILKQRVEILRQENARLHAEFAGLVVRTASASAGQPINPRAPNFLLPVELVRRLERFTTAHPLVSFEPTDKVCRFEAAQAFFGNGDRLRPPTEAALRELAEILNAEQARPFNLLIVGHTAPGAPLEPELIAQHPTDWHLAAHQAIAVQQYLEEVGLAPLRMGVGAYGSQQPIAEPLDDVSRRRNARLEIYLLPPDPPE